MHVALWQVPPRTKCACGQCKMGRKDRGVVLTPCFHEILPVLNDVQARYFEREIFLDWKQFDLLHTHVGRNRSSQTSRWLRGNVCAVPISQIRQACPDSVQSLLLLPRYVKDTSFAAHSFVYFWIWSTILDHKDTQTEFTCLRDCTVTCERAKCDVTFRAQIVLLLGGQQVINQPAA